MNTEINRLREQLEQAEALHEKATEAARVDRIKELETRLNAVQSEITNRRRGRLLGYVTGAIVAVVGVVIGLFHLQRGLDAVLDNIALPAGLVVIGGLIVILAHVAESTESLDLVAQGLKEERVTVGLKINPDELRAEYLFRGHGTELEKYYVQARRQAAQIFWVGVLTILGGFAVVIVALATLLGTTELPTEDKVIAAVLGGAGGILANFVAVIFLKMYADTIQSMADLHFRLVSTHHLLLSGFLSAKIPNPDMRSKTLSEMATAVATGVVAAAARKNE
jgi:hypothetical protein